jgi:hypothetical protein
MEILIETCYRLEGDHAECLLVYDNAEFLLSFGDSLGTGTIP